MRPIPDSFNDDYSRWTDWWTSTAEADNSTWLATKHVDLRSFINYDIERRRTQEELDTFTQAALETYPPLGRQRNIESVAMVAGEFWNVTGTGVHNSYDWLGTPPITVPATAPKIGLFDTAAIGYSYRGMEVTFNGAAVDAELISSIAQDATIPDTINGVDLSDTVLGANRYLHLVTKAAGGLYRDWSSLTRASSYIQLSSNANGEFTSAKAIGTAPDAGESAKVALTGTSPIAIVKAISTFTTSPGAGFDISKVRGVRICLVGGAITSGDKLQMIHGLRVDSVSTEVHVAADLREVEHSTRRGTLHPQLAYGNTFATPTDMPFLVRGTEDDIDGEDPKFVDGSIGVFFNTGGAGYDSGLAMQSNNRIRLILRDGTYDAVDQRTTATLSWSPDGAGGWDASIQTERWDAGASEPSSVVLTSDVAVLERAADEDLVNGFGIQADQGTYYFEARCIGNLIECRIIKADASGRKGAVVASTSHVSTWYKAVRGKTGIQASLPQRDAYIDGIASGINGYATLRSKVFSSPTPVDGAQLVVACSQDRNLFQHAIWLDPNEIFIDATKTTTGGGSFRTSTGLMTNRFLLEDWTQSYIEFDIWVGSGSTAANQPYLQCAALDLDENGDPIEFRIPLPTLQPAQWNRVFIDLERYANQHANLFYHLVLQPPSVEADLGMFWVDGFRVGQRMVEWQVRAIADGEWRSMRRMVNQVNGALHLPRNERGTQLQLQAIALSPDSWIAGYKLMPHYAELGLPLYDESFQTR